MARVLIIGGGISGLTTAYRLQQLAPSLDVTLLEERTRPGGTIWTERHAGFQVELGPNGFLDTKPSTISLSRELGLGNQLEAGSESASRNRYLFLHDRLRLLPTGILGLLTSKVLSWRGKASILAERFRARHVPRHEESIDAFVRRRTGSEVAEVLADALVTGIFAGDPRQLSVRAALPRLAALEEQYGSVLKGFGQAARARRTEAAHRGQAYQRPGKMWSFGGGMRVLVETLAGQLRRPPLFGVTARRLERTLGQVPCCWRIAGEGKDEWSADAVVLACPAYRQSALVAEFDPELAGNISQIPYNRVAVVALGYDARALARPLEGFGYLVPRTCRRDLLGVQWCSSIYPDRAPPGQVLLRAMCGGWDRPEMVGWEDSRLLATVRAELESALGIAAAPVFHQIIRWDRAIPQYVLGHLDRVAAVEAGAARHPGLFLGGNAYHGVALNDCTEQAELLAMKIVQFFANSSFTSTQNV